MGGKGINCEKGYVYASVGNLKMKRRRRLWETGAHCVQVKMLLKTEKGERIQGFGKGLG